MIKNGSNSKNIDEKVRARIDSQAGETEEQEQDGSLSDLFIDQCLNKNVMGDAELFSAICKDDFLYNGNSERWHRWTDHFWEDDLSNSVLVAVGNNVAEKYEDRANHFTDEINKLKKEDEEDRNKKSIEIAIKRRERVYSRAFQLRDSRANRVLNWVPAVAPNLVVKGEEFDTHNHLVACLNGVVNLETGDCLPGKPEDKITLAINHEWPGLDAIPEKTIEHLESVLAAPHDFEGNEQEKADFLNERIDFFHRFVGVSLHGSALERAFIIFYGEHGWNGKGTIMEAFLHAFGDYAAPVAPEVLLKTKGGVDPAKPTPHILAMKGRRYLFASETDEGERFSPAKVKLYSGGETLTGRNPHDPRNTNFQQTHTMYLLLNDYPYAKAGDNAFWDRMNILRFYWSYKDNPNKPHEKKRNPNLAAELQKEAPEIFAWAVRGYHKYLEEGGLNPPETMIKEKAAYRFREDVIDQFVHYCCKSSPDSTYATPFSDIKTKFDPWYLENKYNKTMTPQGLGTLLGKKFKKTTTKDNLPAYVGIQLKENMDD